MATIGEAGQTGESPTGWGVLLAVADEWGITLRVAFLMFIPVAGIVALAIYLGPVGIVTLASVACGDGVRRTVKRRKQRRLATPRRRARS